MGKADPQRQKKNKPPVASRRMAAVTEGSETRPHGKPASVRGSRREISVSEFEDLSSRAGLCPRNVSFDFREVFGLGCALGSVSTPILFRYYRFYQIGIFNINFKSLCVSVHKWCQMFCLPV